MYYNMFSKITKIPPKNKILSYLLNSNIKNSIKKTAQKINIERTNILRGI